MILWMRHGESTWNAVGRMQGQDPRPPLTPRGRRQVEATLPVLHGQVTGILTSPALRAAQSAEIVGLALDVVPVPEPLLVERGLEEPVQAVLERIDALLRPGLASGTLLVTHGDVIGLAAHRLAGASVDPPGNASVLAMRPPLEGLSPWALHALC